MLRFGRIRCVTLIQLQLPTMNKKGQTDVIARLLMPSSSTPAACGTPLQPTAYSEPGNEFLLLPVDNTSRMIAL